MSIQGGAYHAMVNSGCNQTTIHHCLVQGEALGAVYQAQGGVYMGICTNIPLWPSQSNSGDKSIK